MKQRNPIAVALLPFITFGIYSLYWEVKTKGEMNKLGNDIPTAWLLIIPFVNIWWLWKYCEGVEKVTAGKLSQVLAFVLLAILGMIGAAIVQDAFNKTAATQAPAGPQPIATTPSPPVNVSPTVSPAMPPAQPVQPQPTTPPQQPPANPIS